jgi:hypothetical protein
MIMAVTKGIHLLLYLLNIAIKSSNNFILASDLSFFRFKFDYLCIFSSDSSSFILNSQYNLFFVSLVTFLNLIKFGFDNIIKAVEVDV